MIEYKVVTRIEDLPQFSNEYPIFCDIETHGLYIGVRLIQYYQPEISPIVWILDVDYWGENKIPMLKALGKDPKEHIVLPEQVKEFHSNLHLVFWNGTYDQSTLKFGSKEVDDLWYMTKIALPKMEEFGLNYITDKLFPNEDFYQGLDKKKLQKAGFKPGPLGEDQLRYSATDVYVMKLIWDKVAPKVKDKMVYIINKLNLHYAVRWQQTGLKVHQPRRTAKESDLNIELEQVTQELPEDLNVNSYIQVRKAINHDKSDEEALLRLASNGCPYSLNILKKRGILKQLNFLQTYNRDRVYSHYNPMGTRTGRWSAKAGDRPDAANLQQLPRKLKDVFGFEDNDDRIFVGADLPTAELRLASAIYEDHTMYKAFKERIDLHKLTASNTLGCKPEEVTGDQRKKAKAENFGLLYGMKADKFIQYAFTNYGIVLDKEEAEYRRDKWMGLYSGISNKIQEVTRRFYKEELIVFTPLGLPVKPKLYTDALNIPIQGAVAEISKLWIHFMWKEHNKGISDANKQSLPIGNFVHDSITVETTTAEADYWKELLIYSCDKAWSEYNKLPMMKLKDIPMPLDVGISKLYGGAS